MSLTGDTRAQRNDIIRSLLERLDRHSPAEKGHAERVAVYAVATGEELGLKDESLLNLRYAAMLHDVGKISVDAGLLRKVGSLTDEEMNALRLHSMIASSVLESFAWLRPCLADIRHHHERWDGHGYPDGLSGLDIPIGARIINLAEAFDVMVTGPIRDPWTEKAALEEVQHCTGSQFDPHVAEAFMRVQPLIQPVSTDLK